MEMIKEDTEVVKEQAGEKVEIESITEKLKGVDVDKKQRNLLEEDLRAVNSILSMFDAGSDD